MRTRWIVPMLALAAAFPATAMAGDKQEPLPTVTPPGNGQVTPVKPITQPVNQSGPPIVISLGDSAISGEAGRWAGNTNTRPYDVDALGPSAYHDIPGAESTPGCHRSKSAEVHIGGGYTSVNFACSGSKTFTYDTGDSHFKPGLDFYDLGPGKQGQARMLQDYASTHRSIHAVVVLIGANDYGFADIARTCYANWLLTPSIGRIECRSNPDLLRRVGATRFNEVREAIRRGLENVRLAMRNAGYADGDYLLFAQTYTAPLPSADQFRYPETGYSRHWDGGCGIWDTDATWTNDTVVPTFNRTIREAAERVPGVEILEAADAFEKRHLCENGTNLIERSGVEKWNLPGAANKLEWVQKIRIAESPFTTLAAPYQLQEGAHPNYWGQMALRNCFRQAVERNDGGTCERGFDLNSRGEPNMTLR